MRVLFVNLHTGSGTLPLASACLAAALEARFGDAVHCPILELAPGFPPEATAKTILAEAPDIVALTLYVWSRTDLLALAARLHALFRESALTTCPPIILAGGPEVTANPAAIQTHPAIDLAVPGEGEQSIVEIAEALITAPPESRADILSELPSPYTATQAVDLNRLPSAFDSRALAGRSYQDTVWELTRGCPFSCHFCYASKGNKLVRSKSLARAATELAALQARGRSRIFILDPTFNANPQRAKDYLRLFLNTRNSNSELQYHMEIRTEFLDEEQAELFAELGAMLQIGLQSTVPEVARGIGRPFSLEDYQEKINMLHEAGASFGLDLIYGLPGDSLEGFRTSLDFALECRPNHLDIFPLAVLPGTRLHDEAPDRLLQFDSQAPYLVFGSPTFPKEDLERAAELKAAVDELYNKGRAVPWFFVAAEALELSPVAVLDAFIATRNPVTGASDTTGRPEHGSRSIQSIRNFLTSLAGQSGHSEKGVILSDIAGYFSCESAFREGEELPAEVEFTHQPGKLAELIEMGIDDIEELAAFTPKKPGHYRVSATDNGVDFQIV